MSGSIKLLLLAVTLGLAGSAAIAGDGAVGARVAGETCRTAEVNPVTGHVMCIDPLGADVAPAPAAEPCTSGATSGGDWTFHPSCKEQDKAPAGAQG